MEAANAPKPYFSVCIPVYNGEKFIQTSVDSILRQTISDWELVIVDNASTDRTWELLQSYKDHPQVRLYRNESNLGVGGNLNRLLELARGKWMSLLAADDSFVPHALETICSVTRDRSDLILWISAHMSAGLNFTPNVPAVFASVKEFGAKEFAETLYLRGGIFGEISNFSFCRDRYIQTCNHHFPEDTSHVDGDFWMRLMRGNPDGRVIYWPETLVHILVHEESASSVDARTGNNVVEMFHAVEISISVGWRRAVQLRQMARMLWIGLKFYSVLPRDQKFRCFRTAWLLWKDAVRSLTSTPKNR